MKNFDLTTVHGEPSLRLANNDLELFLTRRGGHLAPVRFRLGKRWVEPYALAPWKPDELDAATPPIIKVLRGDYFCFPFGSSKGVAQPHGETANNSWTLAEAAPDRLVMDMAVGEPKCRVRKTISIRTGQRAVYQEHRVEGLNGRFNFGHHAILLFPDKGGPYYVNTSAFRFGSVKPDLFSNPLDREYGALKTGARFTSLDKVALANGGYTSLRRYPARQGFEDLIMVSSRPGDFAWTAATLDGYVWISLKNPNTLPNTLFWLSNGGRHAPPWNGRHLRRLGLEEVCGYYSDGLEISRRDKLLRLGIPTTFAFRAEKPTVIRLIQLAHPVSKGFGWVKSVEKEKNGDSIVVTGSGGSKVTVPVDWTFIQAQRIPTDL